MNEKILVVDDEPKIVKLARDYLEKNGFRVISAGDGNTALAMARQEKPALIILDLMLPGMDGFDVCRTLRRESGVPIIMLTARSEESDQLIGLELGADDYIVKPFSPRALIARTRAVLRRVQGNLHQPAAICIGSLEVDLESHTVTLAGKKIHLTRSEFKLLAALVQHPGQVFTREQLVEHLHGVAYEGYDRSVDSHIKNLRQKMETDPSAPVYIQTIYGIGYKFQGETK
ncbi:MAG: DNA-binding response regulator [Anaerolineaceae bacterium 4572_5.2]|nr:MAG: DNA-binding response regulator [Anaerolineaceae bacterium 4572_5.2]